MPTDIERVDPKASFADVLAEPRLPSRDVQLAFRPQVGQLLLERFCAGDIREDRDCTGAKEASLAALLRACPSDLTDLGLGGQVARQCINARVTDDLLPPDVRGGLLFSHVVGLARLGDPTTRARPAMDTTRQRWSVDQPRDAIGQLALGNCCDTDGAAPGTPAAPAKAEPEQASQPGRLVSRLEKVLGALATWSCQWAEAETSRLRGVQRERCKKALADLKAKVAAMEEHLGLPTRLPG